MKLKRYELKAGESFSTFEFTSEGQKGKIPKLIQFSPTNLKDLFNLAFGDKDLETGEIDDLKISNNGDSEKILATVVASVYAFTDKNPDVWIYATGSTNTLLCNSENRQAVADGQRSPVANAPSSDYTIKMSGSPLKKA